MKIRTDKRGVCVLVCTHGSKKKKGCCRGRGADDLRRAIADEIKERGLKGRIRIRKAGCLGCCSSGPALVTYPDAAICTRVRKKDVAGLVDRLAAMAEEGRKRTRSSSARSSSNGTLATESHESGTVVLEFGNPAQVGNARDVDPAAQLERLDEVVALSEPKQFVRSEGAALPIEAAKRLG